MLLLLAMFKVKRLRYLLSAFELINREAIGARLVRVHLLHNRNELFIQRGPVILRAISRRDSAAGEANPRRGLKVVH